MAGDGRRKGVGTRNNPRDPSPVRQPDAPAIAPAAPLLSPRKCFHVSPRCLSAKLYRFQPAWWGFGALQGNHLD